MKALKLTSSDILNSLETYNDIINGLKDEKIIATLTTLFDELGDRFFLAPASDRLEYHNCFQGGLADHSLRVYENLRVLRDNFAIELTDDSIALVALTHDLGKIGTITDPYYIPNDSQWHMEKLGQMYKHNTSIEFLGVAQRSLRLLEQFGVPTTEAEYKAILIHDGQYVEANRSYAHKEGTLALLLHMADMLAAKTEKEKWLEIQ